MVCELKQRAKLAEFDWLEFDMGFEQVAIKHASDSDWLFADFFTYTINELNE